MPPCGDKIFVRFPNGSDERAATWVEFCVCVVDCVWGVNCEERVNCFDLFFENRRRGFVVIALRYGRCFMNFLAGEICAVRRIGCFDDVVL